MGNPRTVRVIVLLDVKVRPTWKAEFIEETIGAMIAAVVSPAPGTGNLWIDKYRVHTVGNAYGKLLESE